MISAFQRFFTPHFFAPHLRLIYLFLWGGVISALSQPSLLLWLNGIALILFVLLIYRSREAYSFYIKTLAGIQHFYFIALGDIELAYWR